MKMNVTFSNLNQSFTSPLSEANQSFTSTFGEVQVISGGTVEDLDTVLDVQDNLIDELKGILATKASGGKAAVIEPLEVTANGEYIAPDGVDGYSPVVVSVPVPEGYIQPEGILEVNENGTHDVTAFASVNVNVQAGGNNTDIEDAILTRTISGDYSNSRVTKIASYSFQYCKELTSIDFPNVETIGTYAFQSCTKLIELNFPKCKTLETGAFTSCNGVQTATFPVLTTVTAAFNSCIGLKTFYAPMLQTAGNQAFYCCSGVVKFDFPCLTSIGTHCFAQASKMSALILRSDTLCSMANTNALTNTPIAKGTGYIYVPAALLSDTDKTKDYRRATNWSTYAAQFRALEDYTVDGTVNGTLDPAKVGG